MPRCTSSLFVCWYVDYAKSDNIVDLRFQASQNSNCIVISFCDNIMFSSYLDYSNRCSTVHIIMGIVLI